MKKIGAYIHIPFCISKCNYCDFLSFAEHGDLYESYYKALTNEIKQCASEQGKIQFDSVFFGGGTPTVFPPSFICGILKSFPENMISSDAEITTEANPGTVDYSYLKELKNIGINRISFGLQSCDDRKLQTLGRIHTFNEFEQNYNQAVKLGFKNINLDLMFSLPGQSAEDWAKTLDICCGHSPSSISAYALTVEENTPFGKAQREGKLNIADEALDRQMYHYAKKVLAEHGYRHIEISYFSKPGKECRHNLKYWRCEEYLGFGLNAHSYYESFRFRNTSNFDNYIAFNGNRNECIRDKTKINKDEAMSEYMLMGLRLISGIEKIDFELKFGKSVYEVFESQIKKTINNGLVKDENGRIFLTESGLDLANMAMSEFV